MNIGVHVSYDTDVFRPWCWEGLGEGGEGDHRGWDSWMASLTRWTWVWVNSGSWWWTGRPAVLRFMGLQRVGHSWATDLIWSDVEMWELDHNEGWVLKNLCFVIMLAKTLENSLDCREIKPVNTKGYQPWISIGRTDAEALVLWPFDVKSWLIGKDPDSRKDWGEEKKWQRMRW